jgi:hypothetical protein
MIRRLFRFLSVLSLVLCVATCVLWVRSYWVADTLRYNGRVREGRLVDGAVGSDNGTLSVYRGALYIRLELSAEYDHKFYDELNPELIRGLSIESAKPSDPGPVARLVRVVFRSEHAPLSGGYVVRVTAYVLELPHWVLALVFALPPIVSAVQRSRAGRKRSRGLCPQCGYDLRASPDRCPECGAAAATVSA